MKIYTKKGDKGKTSLLGGTKVPKHHIRIEAYGTIDEFNSFVGLVRDHVIQEHTRSILFTIQEQLFTIGSSLAVDSQNTTIKLPHLKEEYVLELEREIDNMSEKLPELKSFILPGGHPVVSFCHIARSICRRAERKVTHLAEQAEIADIIIKYLNRLSDYFFVLARKLAFEFNAEEINWKPQK